MKFYQIYSTIFLLITCYNLSEANKFPDDTFNIISRSIRSSPQDDNKNADSVGCRYEKGPWENCESQNGLQKRTLKLKTSKAVELSNCPLEKFIERPCKKQCKYSKGAWSECINGAKERIDKLRTAVSSAECKIEKQISKQCKMQCTYDKPEWGPCENGEKSKTITLTQNPDTPNNPDCEPTKTINKNCAKGGKTKRFRKKNRE